MAIRGVLSSFTLASLTALRNAAATKIDDTTGTWLFILTATQFHLPFYLTRLLPNTLATVLTTAGTAVWMQGKRPRMVLAILVCAAVVFRCDVIMMAGLVGLHLLATHQTTLVAGIATGIVAMAGGLASSILVDSWFWRRWLWPEGEVLYFNTILNKSHEWGVHPFSWYFISALPRALHIAYPLAALGAFVDRRVRPAFLVALGYAALYSNLGHKEGRFLFPVLPLWNLSAAAAASWLQRRRTRSITWRLVWLAFLAALLAGVGTTAVSVMASKANYPGGTALRMLHHMENRHAQDALQKGKNITVHIDVLPAMTGVTRFGEHGAPWVYSKQENLSLTQKQEARFDYLLSDSPTVPGFTMIRSVEGFVRLRLQLHGRLRVALPNLLKGQLPLHIDTAPAVFIHKRTSSP